MAQTTASPFLQKKFWFHLLAIAFFLVPAGVGFSVKYLDLLILFGSGEDGAFAVIPIMNYLLSSLGFFMLFFWAVRQGMFREIEGVKQQMLDTEKTLDLLEEEEREEERQEAAWR